MNTKSMQNRVSLMVSNPSKLQPGAVSRFNFDRTGGTIGSRGANWVLQDALNRVNPIHCEVAWIDGAFCVIDRCGDTCINESTRGVGAGHIAQLNDGDVLQVGPYKIAVHFNEEYHALIDSERTLGQYDVGELVNENSKQLMEQASPNEEHIADEPYSAAAGQKELQQMTTPSNHLKSSIDPLAAMDADDQRHKPVVDRVPLDPTHFGVSPNAKTQPDFTATASEAVSHFHSTTPSSQMVPGATNLPYPGAQEWMTEHANAGEGGQHLATLPLQQGMQVNLGSMDSSASYTLLQEVGKSVKAALEGIARLYGDQVGTTHSLTMLTRTLQPIEDNPLRLKQSYEDTARAMFSEYRSAVHLSAPAAIEESLEQARIHNIAVIQAIGESLNALLKAFSPDVLAHRFQRYGVEGEQRAGDEAWAWRMYNHYYNEMVSSRQQGLEKLFWEVFEQAYDRAIRMQAS